MSQPPSNQDPYPPRRGGYPPPGPGPSGPGGKGRGPYGPGPYGPPPAGPYGPGPGGPGPYGPPPAGPGPYGPGPHGQGVGGDPYGTVPPGAGPYGQATAPPARRRGSAGKVIAIVGVVLVVLVAAGGYFLYRAVSGVANTVGGLAGGAGGAGGASTSCPAVSTADVNAVLGGSWDVVALGGLGGIAGGVLDSRVLPDAPTCWATQEAAGKLARIARYQGADAAQRFADEKRKAKGSTTDQGNGVSVSTAGYLGKDVQAGDEAFCTTGDMTASAGALVRRGDTLVYVSTTAAGQGASAVPDIDISGSTSSGGIAFGTDKANCDLAVKLIEKVH